MSGLWTGFEWIGKFQAIVSLVVGSIIAAVFFIAGLSIMIRKRNIGTGLLLIFLGAFVLGLSFLIFYLVNNNKYIARGYGLYTVADAIF